MCYIYNMEGLKPTTKKIKEFKKVPDTSITNEYPTSENSLRAPYLMLVIGTRNTGKSYTTAKILHQAMDDKLYDRYFMISPTYDSNRKYWEFLEMDDDDVLYPTRDSIDQIIRELETERDEWTEFQMSKKLYEDFKSKTKNAKNIHNMDLLDLNTFIDLGLLDEDGNPTDVPAPMWKRDIERPCQSCLICDDILGSSALGNAPGLTKLAIQNRHIAPLHEPFGTRAALGLSCFFLSQTYSGGGGGNHGGIPRGLRENATHMIFFRNKSENVFKKILEELGGAIPEEEMKAAYKYAIQDHHDNLLVDLFPKCATKRYRRNLSEFVMFPEAVAQCECKKKKLK